MFYNLIFKYDPDTPNFNNPESQTATTYTPSTRTWTDWLTSQAPTKYQLTACPNFYTPEKQADKVDYRVVEHVDEILDIPQELGSDDEEGVVYLIHKTDDLEAIVWQLYDAGYRPNLKYGLGKLSWVSLAVNKATFVFRSQQLIDWPMTGAWR